MTNYRPHLETGGAAGTIANHTMGHRQGERNKVIKTLKMPETDEEAKNSILVCYSGGLMAAHLFGIYDSYRAEGEGAGAAWRATIQSHLDMVYPAWREDFVFAPDALLTPAEAEERTNWAASSWRNWAAAGRLPGAFKKGKQWLIPLSVVDGWQG